MTLSTFGGGFSYLSRGLSAVLFPPVCGMCQSPMASQAALVCPPCVKSLKPVPTPICSHCGLPVTGCEPHGAEVCLACLAKPPAYRKARFGFVYEGELRKALLRLKFYEAIHLGRALSDFLSQAFHRYYTLDEFDLIVPMPMHPKRLFQRGFNQVVVMGKRLSVQTGIPLDRTSFQKVKDTPPQVGLSRSRRAENVRGSFAVTRRGKIAKRSILLLDDVSTTGATVAEASRTLLQGGAETVQVLVLALRIPALSHASSKSIEETLHSSYGPSE